jgi:hypothetical protein
MQTDVLSALLWFCLYMAARDLPTILPLSQGQQWRRKAWIV